jgi:hypothetical protein
LPQCCRERDGLPGSVRTVPCSTCQFRRACGGNCAPPACWTGVRPSRRDPARAVRPGSSSRLFVLISRHRDVIRATFAGLQGDGTDKRCRASSRTEREPGERSA